MKLCSFLPFFLPRKHCSLFRYPIFLFFCLRNTDPLPQQHVNARHIFRHDDSFQARFLFSFKILVPSISSDRSIKTFHSLPFNPSFPDRSSLGRCVFFSSFSRFKRSLHHESIDRYRRPLNVGEYESMIACTDWRGYYKQ